MLCCGGGGGGGGGADSGGGGGAAAATPPGEGERCGAPPGNSSPDGLAGTAHAHVVAHFTRTVVEFFRRNVTFGLPFLGSLAYRRSTAKSVQGFADASKAEDLHFTDRAIEHCSRLVIVPIPMVYVRHARNTWKDFDEVIPAKYWEPALSPPELASPSLVAQIRAAHNAARRRNSCRLLHQWPYDSLGGFVPPHAVLNVQAAAGKTFRSCNRRLANRPSSCGFVISPAAGGNCSTR